MPIRGAIALISIILIVFGTISYFLTMEFLPQSNKPQVTVVVMGQGTDSKTMEEQVTYPMQHATNSVKGRSWIYRQQTDFENRIVF
ncbi:efflux RND transporter permease subunit [Bacillales bacterium AN1005]